MHKRICRILVTGCAAVMFATLSTAAEADGPRLKFKGKGPVCMCANGGLTEDDIRRANEARQSRLEHVRKQQDRPNREGRGGDRDESNNQE
ncbi:hypothetical protein [Thiohalophilus sp.]|uniref:hypothetical protein n=1 Tax=Thiohalophilus sp. TaxID=3028392 RepID=UPI002ACDFC89|nr:hypothetical protein [Thiohalophilus sp.]MDZ7662405.1 hypothetical protein [Thiohalophilus sp.]